MKNILEKLNLRKIFCGIMLATIAYFSLFAFAAYPAADDYLALRLLIERDVSNLFQALRLGIITPRYFFMQEGTFAHFIVRAPVPYFFSLTLHRIALFVIYWCYVLSIYIFIRTLSKHIFKFDKHIVPCISLIIAFLSINGTGYTAQTFFWWSGALNYPLIFASIMCLLAIVTDLYYNDTLRIRGKIVLHFLAFCLLFLINGSQTAGALLLNCVLFLICLFHTLKSGKLRLSLDKAYLYIYLALSASMLIVNVYGSAGRTEWFYGEGMSAPRALVESLSSGLQDLFSYHHGLSFVLLLVLAPVIAANIPNNKVFRFKHPILASLIIFALFCSMNMPSFYGHGYFPRAGRILSFQYQISYILVFLWFYYLIGYLVTKEIMPIKMKKMHNNLLIIFACALLISGNHLDTLINGNFATGMREWYSGQTNQYLWIRGQRAAIFENDNARAVELKPFPEDLVVMDRLTFEIESWRIWHNFAYERFYGMDWIRTTNDLGDLGMVYRVIAHPTHDAHPSPEYFETEQLVEQVLWVREQLIDVAGRLPLTPDGEVSLHDNVRILLLSDCGEQSFSYNVFPLAFLNARTAEERQTINTSFTASINFQNLSDVPEDVNAPDGSFQMFLVQEHEGSVRYIYQGYVAITGGESFLPPH